MNKNLKKNLNEVYYITPKGTLFPGGKFIAEIDHRTEDGQINNAHIEVTYLGLNAISGGIVIQYPPQINAYRWRKRETLRENRIVSIHTIS